MGRKVKSYLLILIAMTVGCAGPSPIPASRAVKPVDRLAQPVSLPLLPIIDGVEANGVYRVVSGVPQYIIGPGDVLEISLWEGTEEKKHTVTVRPDGNISISFLEDLKVAGLTAIEVDQLITQRLTRFVKHPRVDVLVKEYNSKETSLFGEINVLETGVSGSGNYPLKGKATILDLLVSAGGVKTTGDLKGVKLIREGKTYNLNLYKAMFEGDVGQNVILNSGDVVIVPELSTLADKVIVLGEVDEPGVYSFKHEIDLAAAVGLAGSYLIDAVEESTLVIRRDPNNPARPMVFRANLKRLLRKGDFSQNITLQSGDIVYVPRSYIKDVSHFVSLLMPVLDFLVYPATYRDLYTTGGGLRIDTGVPKTGVVPTYTIPVGGGK